jgi:DNA-directed RNA polymerase sigma subunit (sigma70/sigma32)
LQEGLRKAAKAERALTQTLGREVGVEEVAAAMGEPVEKLARQREYASAVASLDAPVRETEEGAFGDLIADDGPSVEEITEEAEHRREVRRALDALPVAEGAVLSLRFGLGDGVPRTMPATARFLGIGQADVRRLEREGVRRLRTLREAGALLAG